MKSKKIEGVTFAGLIEEIYDDHSGVNPVRVKIESETMLFESYVSPEVGAKLRQGQKMKLTLSEADESELDKD